MNDKRKGGVFAGINWPVSDATHQKGITARTAAISALLSGDAERHQSYDPSGELLAAGSARQTMTPG